MQSRAIVLERSRGSRSARPVSRSASDKEHSFQRATVRSNVVDQEAFHRPVAQRSIFVVASSSLSSCQSAAPPTKGRGRQRQRSRATATDIRTQRHLFLQDECPRRHPRSGVHIVGHRRSTAQGSSMPLLRQGKTKRPSISITMRVSGRSTIENMA